MNYLEELQKTGYTRIPNAVDPKTTRELLDKVLELKERRASAKDLPFLDKSADVVYALCLKDPQFLRVILDQPETRKLLMATLNDVWFRPIPQDKPNFILRGLNARAGSPEAMSIHIDSYIPSPGQYTWSLQVGIALEEHNVETGTTIFVPGSHLMDRYATKEDIANAVPSIAHPGDIVLWDSRLWHATLPNRSNIARWAIIGTFVRWWVKQAFDFTGSLSPELFKQYTDEELAVLGYCSVPPKDETYRVDMKVGYGDIRPR